MSESVTIENATRAERRARAAAGLVLGSELLPGPVPLPDFVSLMSRGTRWRRLAFKFATGAGVAAVAVVGVMFLREAAPISYVVDGTVAIADGIIDAAGDADSERQGGDQGMAASVHFSEGTEVALAAGARLRVVGSTAHGAALALDRGRARFAVTHRSGAHWSVATGPFTVEVVGTRFTLDWSPREERLVVDLTAGSVQVRGASVGGPVAMHPGERLIATAADRRVTLSPLVEAEPLPDDADALPQDEPSPPSSDERSLNETGGGTGRPVGEELSAGALSAGGHSVVARPTGARSAGSRSGGSARLSGSFGGSNGPGRSASHRASSHRTELALVTPSRGLQGREGAAAASAPASVAPAAPPLAEPPATAPVVAVRPSQLVPEVVPHSLSLGGGGGACAREGAQYRFERPESGISLPDFYTLAFSGPRPDRTHSWCGQSSLRLDATFNDAGRRNFFGRFAKETGQVVIRLHRSTDFTGKTVTVHFFVDGPADARFTAELVVVNRGRWVSGPPSGQLGVGRWWTISHTFEAENESGVPGSSNPGPFPEGGTSPVTDCDRLGLAIHSTGGRRVWTGAVFIDDVGWR